MYKAFFAALLLSLVCAAPAWAAKGDAVVILHGLGRTKSSMQTMAEYFEKHGYEVLNIDYESRKFTVEELVEKIDADITAFNKDKKRKIDFVGYSMGGVLTRVYLKKHKPKNLGRVVLLGTPNRGSEVADFMDDFGAYKKYYGPGAHELTTDHNYDKLLGKVDYPLGSIAGDRSIDPISSLLIIDGRDDGKVSIESTKVRGMADHIILHATHTFMMSNSEAIRQARYFIENGAFDHKPDQ